MKQLHTGIIVIVLLVVGFFVFNRGLKETYTLPDFINGSESSNVCPDGFMLVCITNDLSSNIQTPHFPESLTPPCKDPAFPSFPLCVPQQRNMRPPSVEYRLKR